MINIFHISREQRTAFFFYLPSLRSKIFKNAVSAEKLCSIINSIFVISRETEFKEFNLFSGVEKIDVFGERTFGEQRCNGGPRNKKDAR